MTPLLTPRLALLALAANFAVWGLLWGVWTVLP
jgi:hypothetical protein